jgi:hypothetical protein
VFGSADRPAFGLGKQPAPEFDQRPVPLRLLMPLVAPAVERLCSVPGNAMARLSGAARASAASAGHLGRSPAHAGLCRRSAGRGVGPPGRIYPDCQPVYETQLPFILRIMRTRLVGANAVTRLHANAVVICDGSDEPQSATLEQRPHSFASIRGRNTTLGSIPRRSAAASAARRRP